MVTVDFPVLITIALCQAFTSLGKSTLWGQVNLSYTIGITLVAYTRCEKLTFTGWSIRPSIQPVVKSIEIISMETGIIYKETLSQPRNILKYILKERGDINHEAFYLIPAQNGSSSTQLKVKFHRNFLKSKDIVCQKREKSHPGYPQHHNCMMYKKLCFLICLSV